MLASRFGKHSHRLRSNQPLTDDQIRAVAPSIFATAPHAERSDRYAYIPTIDVLRGLQNEGFQPFMVCQTRVRAADKHEFTKHMVRLRHRSEMTAAEAREFVLLNSHDGTSAYQMLGGMLRFVCDNGLICGEAVEDIRIPHKGDVKDRVIEGAYTVLNNFDNAIEEREAMKATRLDRDQQRAFATAALSLRYDNEHPAPINPEQLLITRRLEDRPDNVWTTFQRTQENLTQGGMRGRSTNGRRVTTRPITGIDQDIKLNRALWVLANELRKLH